MRDRFPGWNRLPLAFVERCRGSLEPLGCLQQPVERLADSLADTAVLHGISGASALPSIFVALVAANHSADRLSWPNIALPCDEKEKKPTITEWILLAAVDRARSELPIHVATILDDLAIAIGSCDGRNESVLDYGMGALLPALTNRLELENAGRAMGQLARLCAEILAILDPQRSAPRPTLLTRLAIDVGLGSRAAHAAVCAAKPIPDKLPLVCLLGDGRVRQRVLEMTSQWGRDAEPLQADSRTNPLSAFVSSTISSIGEKTASARIFGFLPSRHPPVADLDRTIDLARAALEFDPELRSVWEIQRWGDWCTEARVGKVFPVGLCLLALVRTGFDASSRIEEMIVQTRRPDGWRYYENWTDIPPDTDDLGLILRLFACLREPRIDRDIFVRSFDLVRQTISKNNEFPVWLYDGLQESVSEKAPNWLGPRCIAVAAQMALGMIEADIQGQDDLRNAAIEWIVDSWENRKYQAVFHYTWPFARLLLTKLARAAARSPHSIHSQRLQAIVMTIADEIRQSVHGDGGWGSPLATACHLAVLALSDVPFDPWPGLTYLASRQGPDGMWPAEPLYRCPGKDGAATAHGAIALTTAVCLDGLLDVKAYLARAS